MFPSTASPSLPPPWTSSLLFLQEVSGQCPYLTRVASMAAASNAWQRKRLKPSNSSLFAQTCSDMKIYQWIIYTRTYCICRSFLPLVLQSWGPAYGEMYNEEIYNENHPYSYWSYWIFVLQEVWGMPFQLWALMYTFRMMVATLGHGCLKDPITMPSWIRGASLWPLNIPTTQSMWLSMQELSFAHADVVGGQQRSLAFFFKSCITNSQLC